MSEPQTETNSQQIILPPPEIAQQLRSNSADTGILGKIISQDPELLNNIATLKLAELFSLLSGYIAQVPTNHEWNIPSETIMDYLGLNELKLEKLKRNITEALSEIKI